MIIREANNPVADRINSLIQERGLKQKAVAERAKLTAQTLNDMLNGRRVIKMSDAHNLCKALNVTPNELFAAEEERDSA